MFMDEIEKNQLKKDKKLPDSIWFNLSNLQLGSWNRDNFIEKK